MGETSSRTGFWRRSDIARWVGWAVLLLAAGLYVWTLDTGLRPDELGGGDLITHQYAQAQARLSNAPGYPLYTMGGWLWFRFSGLVLGWLMNPVQRLAAYSTLWALLALYVLYRLVLRVTGGRWLLAALSTLFYAVTYFFWYYSVTTEQYTMAIFQTLLVVWLAFKWDDEIGEGENSDQAARTLTWLALVVGSCLANLVTTLAILPPLVWFVLSRQPDLLKRGQLLLRLLAAGCLPVLSYAYVYLRGAAHPEWWGTGEWPSPGAWFFDFLTTGQGRDELAPGLSFSRFFTDEFPSLIWDEMTLPVLILGVVGVWLLGRRRAWLIVGSWIIYLVFCWVDRFGNWYQVIMPVYPLLVLGMAAGLNAVLDDVHDPPRLSDRVLPYLVPLFLAVLVAVRFMMSLPQADQSWRVEDTGLDSGWVVLADNPVGGANVAASHTEWLALEYLTGIWGAEPAVAAHSSCQAERLLAGSRDSFFYITRQAAAADPACVTGLPLDAAGASLIRAQAAPDTQLPASAQPLDLVLGDGLVLVGYEHNKQSGKPSAAPDQAQDGWRLSLYWQAEARPHADYVVSVRPMLDGVEMVDAGGGPVLQDHQPVWNAYPTSHWMPGEVVRDDYVLPMAPAVFPDGVHVVVYLPTIDEQGEAGFEDLGDVSIMFDLFSQS